MTITELEQWMQQSKAGDPAQVAEDAIRVYHAAAAHIAELERCQKEAKAVIAEIMEETGFTTIETPAGKAMVSAPSTSISYDAKALDILMRDDADLAMRLAPYRKEAQRAGSMRITAK